MIQKSLISVLPDLHQLKDMSSQLTAILYGTKIIIKSLFLELKQHAWRWEMRIMPLIACYVACTIGLGFSQERQESASPCIYQLYGICDPFVLGIFVSDNGNVHHTWLNSPAEKAGICPGDTIIQVGDEPFSIKAVVGSEPSPVRLKVRRDNDVFERTVGRIRESELRTLSGIKEVEGHIVPIYQTQELPIILKKQSSGPHPGFWSIISGDSPGDAHDRYFLGFRLLRLVTTREVIVESVDCPSPACDARLQLGDRILSINGKDVKLFEDEDLRHVFQTKHPSRILLRIANPGRDAIIPITAVKYSEFLSRIGRKLTACGPLPIQCTCPRH